MLGLGDLGGQSSYSAAFGVSSDGLVVTGASRSPLSGNRTEAFRWTDVTGMVGLGDLPGGAYSSGASGISRFGTTIAGSSMSTLSPSLGEAFVWDESGGMTGLGVIPGAALPATVPRRMSADGAVVVGWAFTANGREAFRWEKSTGLVGLGDLPGVVFDSQAMGVSADGRVIAGIAHGEGLTSFRWTVSTGMEDLGSPEGGSGSEAYAISADGTVIVGGAGVNGEVVPMIWSESSGMRNLLDILVDLGLGEEIEGWDLEQALAVSANGLYVAGLGYNPSGREEAWVVYLGQPSVLEVPTVSKVGLAIFGALLCIMAALGINSGHLRMRT